VKDTIKYFAEIGITKQSIIDSGEHISDFVRDEDIGGDIYYYINSTIIENIYDYLKEKYYDTFTNLNKLAIPISDTTNILNKLDSRDYKKYYVMFSEEFGYNMSLNSSLSKMAIYYYLTDENSEFTNAFIYSNKFFDDVYKKLKYWIYIFQKICNTI